MSQQERPVWFKVDYKVHKEKANEYILLWEGNHFKSPHREEEQSLKEWEGTQRHTENQWNDMRVCNFKRELSETWELPSSIKSYCFVGKGQNKDRNTEKKSLHL
jgi:hypothetical protein